MQLHLLFVSLLQKIFLAFLLAMGIIVTQGDAFCFSKLFKPGEAEKGRTEVVISLNGILLVQFYAELLGRGQNIKEVGGVRKTWTGGSGTKFPKLGKNKVFPWTGYSCSNIIIAIGGRLLMLFLHMEVLLGVRGFLNSVWS